MGLAGMREMRGIIMHSLASVGDALMVVSLLMCPGS